MKAYFPPHMESVLSSIRTASTRFYLYIDRGHKQQDTNLMDGDIFSRSINPLFDSLEKRQLKEYR